MSVPLSFGRFSTSVRGHGFFWNRYMVNVLILVYPRSCSKLFEFELNDDPDYIQCTTCINRHNISLSDNSFSFGLIDKFWRKKTGFHCNKFFCNCFKTRRVKLLQIIDLDFDAGTCIEAVSREVIFVEIERIQGGHI